MVATDGWKLIKKIKLVNNANNNDDETTAEHLDNQQTSPIVQR